MWELIPLLAIVFTIGVPSVALATHLVLRPLVRDIIVAIQTKKTPDEPDVYGRLGELEDGLDRVERQLGQLLEAERFRRELESGTRER